MIEAAATYLWSVSVSVHSFDVEEDGLDPAA